MPTKAMFGPHVAPVPAGAPLAMPARRAIAAAGIGNMLEYYDFGIYGFLAPVIGRKFFPNADEVALLLATFAAFGVGFLARPLGGIVLGWFGDVRGRKAALVASIVLMAAGTAGIGLIPDYSRIGVLAPILLVLCRVLQGFSAGGERGNAISFIVEWAPEGRRGYFGSFVEASIAAGLLLSSAIAAGMNSVLTASAIDAWAWRVPFLLGAAIVPVATWLRRDVDETPRFEQERSGQSSGLGDLGSPFVLVAKAFGFSVMWTVAFYMMLNYLPTFTQRYAGLSASAALWANTAALLALLIAIPPMGALSDRIGRKPMLIFSCVALTVLIYPGFRLMLSGPGVLGIALIQIGFNLIIATFSGPGPAALSELFPTRSRTTLMSVGYSLAAALFGGFAPFVATWLIERTGDPTSPTFYLVACGVVSIATVATFRETGFERLR